MRVLLGVFILLLFYTKSIIGQEIAVLKYQGGGDWYANPTALPNLIQFCNTNIGTKINGQPTTVEAANTAIFQYPFVHMTGHGNVIFNPDERENLRNYLLSGGFLHIDDNYGMREYILREIDELFPDTPLEEVGLDHPIFNEEYKFPQGLPKIHEHDGERPKALGIFSNKRLVLLLTLESDLGDGWEDEAVHNDPAAIRTKALQMGANIVSYTFKN